MTSFAKKYISALIHNPNLLKFGEVDFEVIQKENDSRAIPSVFLLLWSKTLSENLPLNHSAWIERTSTGRYYPPFHDLFALVKGKVVNQLEKGKTVRSFRKEIMYLKHIFKNFEPDNATLFSKPLIVDLFGNVHEKYEVEIKEPKILKWWNLPPKYREEPSWVNH